MKILAIETSCDETACAVVEDGVKILSSAVASSTTMQEKYGGIVPEVAAREQLRYMLPILTSALKPLDTAGNIYKSIKNQVDALAVTVGPGLIGSLLVGVETAKTLALVTGKPIIPVNHVLAHMYANFVNSQPITNNLQQIQFPAISLVVSGGHTELYLLQNVKDLKWLGGTLDDAAGEAFDKTARLLGFGNGGGPAVAAAAAKFKMSREAGSRSAGKNEKSKISLPRPLIHDATLNFSFSGLKTAIWRQWKSYPQHAGELINELAHEVQESITDVLVIKTLRAGEKYQAKSILISGGVAANLRLREKFESSINQLAHQSINLFVPPVTLCTDNAVYIAAYAYFRGQPTDWHNLTALPDLSVEEV